jgi:DNA adenine methylase
MSIRSITDKSVYTAAQKIIQPFKTYNGGKSGNGVYQQIINLIPKCDVFIDAMVGNGGIASRLRLPAVTVINDYDAGVIDKYVCVITTDINVYGGHGIFKENLHSRALIDKYDYGTRSFFYFDPPYLKSTRRSSRDLYKHEWTESDHVEFLSKVVNMKSKCMISHYPCTLYNEALKGWHTHTFEAQTRQGKAIECLYMNYPAPAVLQDYRYIGKDFTDRQRIKRKISRWVAILERLPVNERSAIISEIIQKYDNK